MANSAKTNPVANSLPICHNYTIHRAAVKDYPLTEKIIHVIFRYAIQPCWVVAMSRPPAGGKLPAALKKEVPMCWIFGGSSVEKIIDKESANMNDAQKSQYWYELSMNIFRLLGRKNDYETVEITAQDWKNTALATYPTLSQIKIPDGAFYIITETELQEILSRDWTNLVPYVAELSDCDKFASRLYDHLVTYYKVTAVLPVWGDTDEGYHGFNLAVFKNTAGLYARLVEPQTDNIFITEGPLGTYVPRMTAVELGIKRIPVASQRPRIR